MARFVTGGEAELLVNLSYNIRYAIRDKNTSAAAIARKADIPAHIVRAYMKGQSTPDYKTVEKIATALDCTVADLTKKYDTSMPNSD